MSVQLARRGVASLASGGASCSCAFKECIGGEDAEPRASTLGNAIFSSPASAWLLVPDVMPTLDMVVGVAVCPLVPLVPLVPLAVRDSEGKRPDARAGAGEDEKWAWAERDEARRTRSCA